MPLALAAAAAAATALVSSFGDPQFESGFALSSSCDPRETAAASATQLTTTIIIISLIRPNFPSSFPNTIEKGLTNYVTVARILQRGRKSCPPARHLILHLVLTMRKPRATHSTSLSVKLKSAEATADWRFSASRVNVREGEGPTIH